MREVKRRGTEEDKERSGRYMRRGGRCKGRRMIGEGEEGKQGGGEKKKKRR